MPTARTTGVAAFSAAGPRSRTGLEEATARSPLWRVGARRGGVAHDDLVSLGEAGDHLGLAAVRDADQHVHRSRLAFLQVVDAPVARALARRRIAARRSLRPLGCRSARDAGRPGPSATPVP